MVSRGAHHRYFWLGIWALALVPLIPAAWTPLAPARNPVPFHPNAAGSKADSLPAARTTWAKTYGGPLDDENGTLLKENGDGTCFVSGWTESTPGNSGDLLLMKVDSDGNVVWQKTYGSSANEGGWITTTPDGGFAIVVYSGSSVPLRIVKLDGSGEISWQKSYGTAGDTFNAVQVLPGGGYLLSRGEWQPTPTLFGSNWLMRLDTDGTILWQKKYSSPTLALSGASPAPLADGSYLVGAQWMDATYRKQSLLWKLDSNGAIVWQRQYTTPTGTAWGSFSPTPDGGCLLGGKFDPAPWPGSGKNDLLIAKLDASGNIGWQKTYGTADNDTLEFIFPTDGGYLFSGSTKSGGENVSLIGKVDTAGDLLWANTYGGAQDYLFAADGEASGGHLLQGLIQTPTNEDYYEFWAVNVGAGGTIQWQRAYGGTMGGEGVLTRAGNGGLLLTGSTKTVGAGQDDLWFWSLDSQGQLGYPCPLMRDTGIVPVPVVFEGKAGTLAAVNSDVIAEDSSYTAAASTMAVHTIAFSPRDVCSAPPALEAHASADPTSGAVPLTVQFAGSATGGYPPYTYSWNFSDGAPPSTEQNPSHVFTAAGNFSVYLTVTDALQSAAGAGVGITVTGACVLSCTTLEPTTGTVGKAITFISHYYATECPGEPTFAWTFGDQTEPVATQSASHTYTTPGTYTWTYTVTLAGHVCSDQGTIVIETPLPGDCDSDGTVSIGEVQKAINMFLGTLAPDCGVDCNGDGTVSIGEVQKVINAFLGLAASC
jgi:PKD repeat protein